MALYSDTLRDEFNRPIAGALVTVSDDAGALVDLTNIDGSPLSNPFVTDVQGDVAFQADDGQYTIEYRYGGRLVQRDRNVVVGDLIAAVNPNPANAGLYLGWDADGNPAALPGTGNTGIVGNFAWHSGNYSTQVAADPLGFIYVPDAIVPVTSGVWIRQTNGVGVNVLWGGAVGDDVTDDQPVFQAALDLISALAVGPLLIPVPKVAYKLGAPLRYRSLTPLTIEGVGAVSGTKLVSTKQVVALHYTGDPSLEALDIQSSGATLVSLSGFTLRNILLYTSDQASNSGGVGFTMRGCYPFRIDNVTISGFATGALWDDNPISSGADTNGNGKGLVTSFSICRASYRRWVIKGTVDTSFINCQMLEESIANYDCDLVIDDGTNGRRSDSLQFRDSAFIGTPLTAPEYPSYNVKVLGQSLFITFDQCAFEQSKVSAVYCEMTPTTSATEVNLTLNNCHWNGHTGRCLDALGACVNVVTPRGDSISTTLSAFRFRGGTSGFASIRGGITGGTISFSGPAGIEIDNARNVTVRDVSGADLGGHGNPLVKFGANAQDCQAMGLLPSQETTPATLGWVDNGTGNSEQVSCGAQAGSRIAGGPNFNNGSWTTGVACTLAAQSGALGAGATATLDYLQQGNTASGRLEVYTPALGTAAGSLIVTLPFNGRAAYQAGGGRDVAGGKGAVVWTMVPGQTNQMVLTKDDAFPAAAGSRLVYNFMLEM